MTPAEVLTIIGLAFVVLGGSFTLLVMYTTLVRKLTTMELNLTRIDRQQQQQIDEKNREIATMQDALMRRAFVGLIQRGDAKLLPEDFR